MKIFKHKKKFIGSIIFSCAAVALSLYTNLKLPSVEKIAETAETSIRTYPASAQSCPVTYSASGDTCVGGTEIGWYHSFQVSGAYPGVPSTSGNIAFANNPGHCAAVGGNCYQYVYDYHSEYGTYETYDHDWKCFSGSTGVTPNGTFDSWDGYGSTDYDSSMISCSAGNANPNVPTLSGTNSIAVNAATANSVVATDPEGDQIFYEIDWDGNGTVDGTTSTVNSGVSSSISHTYSSAGTYGVKARSVQANNTTKKSAWSAAYNITVTSGGGGGTGCWTAVELGSWDPPCAEGPAPGGGVPSVTTPQGTTIYADYNSMSSTYPSCGANVEGGSINTTTYPSRVCFMNFNEPYNSYQNGCVSSSHINTLMIDGGTCSAPPSYNCEAGNINPSLSIVSNHSLLGVALNNAMRWYTNIWGGTGVGGCFYNTSGKNIFVPTKTQAERNSFLNNLPSGVMKSNGGW